MTAGDPVPFFSLAHVDAQSSASVSAAIRRVQASRSYIRGVECEAFEAEFADFCGAAGCVGVANGFDALALSFKALDIHEGDEVLVPQQTFVATWMAVSSVGAKPVGLDVDESSALMLAENIGPSITQRTKAVVPVHLFGRVWQDAGWVQRLDELNVPVIEDAAQAHGAATFRDSRQSRAMCFSFYPTKNLGALGDAGCVVSNDEALVDEVRLISNYGSRIKYMHDAIGTNSRMDELQAAVLRARLPFLDEWNHSRREIAQLYITQLDGLPISLPAMPPANEHAWHLFVVKVSERDSLRSWLAGKGIETGIHYPLLPSEQLCYQGADHHSSQVSHTWAREALSLPLWPGMPHGQIRRVVDAIQEYFDAAHA